MIQQGSLFAEEPVFTQIATETIAILSPEEEISRWIAYCGLELWQDCNRRLLSIIEIQGNEY